MRNLALGALFIGLIAACGGGKSNAKVVVPDASVDSGTGVCNVLTQTGCMAGEKCTWFEDATTPQPLGHIGCAPDGTVATAGACTYGAPGATGYDNCQKGNVCQSAKCKLICDQNGGAPMCPANFACGTYEGLFGPAGQPVAAGVCDPSCNPLTENTFGSGHTATKVACAANQGCYGEPSSSRPSQFTCSREVNTTLYHRSACTVADGCAPSANSAYLNGCAQGYIPLLFDAFGSMQVDCIAICKPTNCYVGNCAAGQNLTGDPATGHHQCNNQDANGTFLSATETVNGEQCMFSWLFEIDMMGKFVRSPTSDTVGFCVDHSKYKWDSNGDGMVTAADDAWIRCDDGSTTSATGYAAFGATTCGANGATACGVAPYITFGSAAGQAGAADFGCVTTTTGGVMFDGKEGTVNRHVLVEMPHTLYHRTFAQ